MALSARQKYVKQRRVERPKIKREQHVHNFHEPLESHTLIYYGRIKINIFSFLTPPFG